MANFKTNEKFNYIYTGFIIVIFILIAIANFFKFGFSSGYNKTALLIYGFGATIGVVLSLYYGIFGVFNSIKKRSDGLDVPFRSGHIAESSDYNPISKSLLLRFGIHFFWIVIVILSSVSGFQIWGTPDIYSGAVEFSTEGTDPELLATTQQGFLTSFWDVAINPGFTEDINSFGLSSIIVVLLTFWLYMMKFFTNSNIYKMNKIWYIVFVIIACPLASLGFGFIPGFAQAHINVAGENFLYLFATFIFQTFNLYIMWFTGLFFPLAHIIHNGIFLFGFSFALSIAFFCLVPLYKNKKLYGVKRNEIK